MSTNIYIKTYGCALNRSDSELMAGLLEKSDFKVVKNIDDSFIIIVNTCTVKGPTENKLFKFLDEVKANHPYKKVIITGCIAQTDSKKLKGYPLLGTAQVSNIVQLVEEVLAENPIEMLDREELPRINLPHKRRNPFIEIIPICEGCLGSPCTYCKVKEARGNLRSYSKEDIVAQAKSAIKDRVKEIWLTAQDTGCYGGDIGSSLPELLKELIALSGDFKIRLGMCNPNYALKYLDELIEIFKSEKIYKFLHIPVQSGNNEILKEMKRKYTREEYIEIVKRFKQAIPQITIATDIIVGFPGETEEQFQDSLNLVKETKPPVLNISRFWPRSNTKAAEMENQIDSNEVKRRSVLMTDIAHNIFRMENEKWIGWQGDVLIIEKGKDETLVGRNFAYKPIIVNNNHKIGDTLFVKIRKVSSFDLKSF